MNDPLGAVDLCHQMRWMHRYLNSEEKEGRKKKERGTDVSNIRIHGMVNSSQQIYFNNHKCIIEGNFTMTHTESRCSNKKQQKGEKFHHLD